MIIQERRSTFLTLFNASCPLKRSYMLKQTWSFHLQVWLRMAVLWPPDDTGVIC